MLCRANLCLWRALNIYDDFLDGEGIAKELPTANGYYRRFLRIYYRLRLSPAFYRLFERTLDDLDRSNREEAAAKGNNKRLRYPRRFPPFKELPALSRKSLPLGLGAAAIMDITEGHDKQNKMAGALEIFRYALAAKQLSDDSCDWLDDLKTGTITPANALVLKAIGKRTADTDSDDCCKVLYFVFINEAAPRICAALRRLCSKARRSAAAIDLYSDSPLLTGLISPIEAAVARAEAARARFS